MSAQASGKLQVLVTGVGAAISGDVVRLIRSEGAVPVAADPDPSRLARLERELGLSRVAVETKCVDLANPAEVQLWRVSLNALSRLPRLMICCCAAPTGHRSRVDRYHPSAQLPDVALDERKDSRCPALLAERVLRPTLFLHAEPLRHATFDRTLSVIRRPTLRAVLARASGHAAPNLDYSSRRQSDGETTRGGRLRLVPPSERPQGRADAA